MTVWFDGDGFSRRTGWLAKRFITAVGAISIAIALGSASFVVGYRAEEFGNLAVTNNIGIGLLLSIAVGVWGIFALLLWATPKKG